MRGHVAVSCRVLQCIAVCCSVLQCVAVCCSVFVLCVAVFCLCVAVCCSVLQCVAADFVHCTGAAVEVTGVGLDGGGGGGVALVVG